MVKVPTPFFYTNDKSVPWNYTNQIITSEPQTISVSPRKEQGASVNDIVGTGGMICSGRCYTPNCLGEKEGEKRAKKCAITKDEGPRNEPVTETKANEFLKFIKHSEYNIVEQLHKVTAKISLLALFLNSEPHREAMLKVLKQTYVPHNSPIDKIDRLVGNIMMDNYI